MEPKCLQSITFNFPTEAPHALTRFTAVIMLTNQSEINFNPYNEQSIFAPLSIQNP